MSSYRSSVVQYLRKINSSTRNFTNLCARYGIELLGFYAIATYPLA
jgi:hypothetical protein